MYVGREEREGLILSMQVGCSTHWVCIDDRGNAVVVQVSLSSHHALHTDDTYRGEEGGGGREEGGGRI